MTDRYDYYVFDLDGTLVDVEPNYIRDIFDRVGDRLGVTFTDTQSQKLWHGLNGSRDDQLAELDIDPADFWRVFHDEEDPTARAESSFLYQDANVVSEFDRPTVLVTHCQQYLTEAVLERLDIEDWFETVVCCSDEIGWKPDPRPVEKAISAAGLSEDQFEGVMIGDSPQDIGAAWNAGLDGAHIERHSPELRGLCVVDYRLSRIDELV